MREDIYYLLGLGKKIVVILCDGSEILINDKNIPENREILKIIIR